jgi:cytochrome c oxidase subunit 2
MDKYENRILILTGAVLVIFLFAILRAASTGASDVPACLPYDASYLEPRIEQLDDSTYQVFCVAQMWNFQPTEIYLPVGAEVDFYLTTKDVVHGFHINEKNINMMAVYGGINKTTAKFNEPGVFPIVCHEYCGSGHQHMKAEVIVNYPR